MDHKSSQVIMIQYVLQKRLVTDSNLSVDVASVMVHLLLRTIYHPVSQKTTIQTENPHNLHKAIAQTDALL